MSTLGPAAIQRVSLHVPPSGAWLADVILLEPPAPTGRQTLTIGDLSLVGTVLPGRGGEDSPARPHLIVAGGAGWGGPILKAGSYQAPGLRLSTILRDLAAASGEPYDAPADTTVGRAFSWQATSPTAPQRLSDVLDNLAAFGIVPTWRVAPNGRTRFDAWPTGGEASGLCEIGRRDLARGMRRCALDASVAAFLPGGMVEGERISRLILTETSGATTAEVYTVAPPSLKRSLRRIISTLFPWVATPMPLTYLVGKSDAGTGINADGTCNLDPPPLSKLARLPRVPQWGSALRVMPAIGDEATVVFRDGDRRLPVVVAFGPPASVAAVARVGDHAGRLAWDSIGSALYYSASETAAYAPVAVSVGPPIPSFAGTRVVLTTGSAKVSAG